MRFKSHREEETFQIGERLGRVLKAWIDRGKALKYTVCLYGDLGAGKTVFVKGLARALGLSPRDIGSVSFVLAAEYKTIPPFYHVDLYRIEDIEMEEWIWDYMEKGICAIEWAEKLKEVPRDSIIVHIKHGEKDEREITIEGINQEDWNNLKDWQT